LLRGAACRLSSSSRGGVRLGVNGGGGRGGGGGGGDADAADELEESALMGMWLGGAEALEQLMDATDGGWIELAIAGQRARHPRCCGAIDVVEQCMVKGNRLSKHQLEEALAAVDAFEEAFEKMVAGAEAAGTARAAAKTTAVEDTVALSATQRHHAVVAVEDGAVPLSASQRRAMAAALDNRSLFVTGPAGVGKSYCVGRVAGAETRSRQSST
jgi:hypothetical protein